MDYLLDFYIFATSLVMAASVEALTARLEALENK